MQNSHSSNKEGSGVLRNVIISAIIGGILGMIFNSIYSLTTLTFGIIIGVLSGAVIGALIGLKETGDKPHGQTIHDVESVLELREEQLNISKKRIDTGKVKMHRETLAEDKNITVPVKREELVIEKTIMDSKAHGQTETIRIPISEEQVDISKHSVPLEDVSVYEHEYQEVAHVKETLRKEKLHVDVEGNVKVMNTRENGDKSD